MLPRIDSPTYSLTLPLSKKQITFRPFLVKEQRNLLMAMESNDTETVERNVKQVLQNCTLTEGVDIDKLPLVDVEFYFINLRARSVSEIVENKYKCTTKNAEDKTCNNVMEVKVNLLDIQLDTSKIPSNKIKITDKITVNMKYPEFSVMKRVGQSDNVSDFAMTLIAESIESIHDGEQFYYAHETPPGELVEWLETLDNEQFAKIENFFENLPKLNKKIEITCSKCSTHHTIDVEGLDSFFV